jgi:hypothetical protein
MDANDLLTQVDVPDHDRAGGGLVGALVGEALLGRLAVVLRAAHFDGEAAGVRSVAFPADLLECRRPLFLRSVSVISVPPL